MNMSRSLSLAIAAAVLVLPAQASAVNPCYLDNNSGASYQTPLHLGTTHSPTTGQIACGHVVSGSGCTVDLPADLDSSGNCLSLGKGVTFDGLGHALHCTNSSFCYSQALLTEPTTPAGSGATTIQNLKLTGCWLNGIVHDNTNNGIADDIVIDYPATCETIYIFGQPVAGPGEGIVGFNTVRRASVTNATIGIELQSNNDVIEDSVINSCDIGVYVTSTVTGTKLVNGLVDGNTRSVYAGTGTARLDSDGSVFRNAGANGHCGSGSDFDDCIEVIGSRASFEDLNIR